MKNMKAVIRPVSLAVALSFVSGAWAIGNGSIVSGTGNIVKENNGVTVNQNTDKMVINWDNMNVGKNETLNFNQLGANSAVLNKISSIDPTLIQGALNANGRVFIVNPNGVLIGNGAAINVGSLVASSLDMNNDDFNREQFHFSGKSQGKVVNEGEINAKGSVGLISAGEVNNQGSITTARGNVNLASGSDITLSFPSFGKMDVKINQGSLNALVNNGGIVVAKGGNIRLTAWATDQLTRGVINNTGILEATNLTYQDDGSVYLTAAGNHNGSTNVGGSLSAGLIGQNAIEGANVTVLDGAKINAPNAVSSITSNKKDGYVNVGNATFNSDTTITADNVLSSTAGKKATFTRDVRINTRTNNNSFDVASANVKHESQIKAGRGVVSADFVSAVANSKQSLSVSTRGGDISVNNARQDYGDLGLYSSNGNVNLNKAVRGSALQVSAKHINQAQDAKIDVDRDVTLHAYGDMALKSDITAGGSATLAAEGNLNQAAGSTIQANRKINYSGNTITLNGDSTAESFDIAARQRLVQGSEASVKGNTAIFDGGDFTLSGQNNAIRKVYAQTKNLNFTNASDVELVTGSRVNGNLSMSGGRDVTLSDISVANNADIAAAGNVTIQGGSAVGGNAHVKGNNIYEKDGRGYGSTKAFSVGGRAELSAENNITGDTIKAGVNKSEDLVLSAENVSVKNKIASHKVIVNQSGVSQPADPVEPVNPAKPTTPERSDAWNLSPDDPLSIIFSGDSLYENYIRNNIKVSPEQFIEDTRIVFGLK